MADVEKEKHTFDLKTLLGKIADFREERTTAGQDIRLCAAVSLACAFYEFEYFIPALAAVYIKAALTVLFVICWLWCSFLNGFWGRYAFPVYAVLFWVIPRLIILRQENTGILDYNKYLDAASQYSRLLVSIPLNGLSALLNTTELYLTAALLLWCLCLFYAGRHFRKAIL